MTNEVGRGTVLAGRYRVDDPLPTDLDGVSVWRATDQILDRPVRVRVLESGAVAPALDAARRAALVTDARLVRVLDVGTHEGVGYVVSEQIVGASLAQLVERGSLTPDQARAVVGEAAAALEVARRRGVHHLALRPSVVHVSADGRVLVSGLAIDAALLGSTAHDARSTSRQDTVDLVRLLYTGLTGRWPAQDDDVVATPVPAAPVTEGTLVPPAELAPAVPNDLDTLCVVTLGPHDDGPHTPGELVHELEPWGEIRVGRAAEEPAQRAGAPGAVAAAADATAVMAEGLPDELQPPTEPVRVPRQSVRSAFEELPQGTPRPGTPPPAAPARTSIPPRVERTNALAGGSTPPVLPATLPSVQHDPAQAAAEGWPVGDGWDDGSGFTQDPFGFVEEEPPARRFDPTALVLVVVGVVVLVGLVFAARSLFSTPLDDREVEDAAPVTSQEPAETPQDPEPTQDEPEPTQPTDGPPPTIQGIRTFDPTDPAGERVENVEKAIDGDPGSFWFSYTYNRPDFGGLKPGMGLELTLAEETQVSGVTIDIQGTGGNVEVRASTGEAPQEGPLLASSTLGGSTDLPFAEPVTTKTIVLYFTELPTNAAGQFRLEVTEVKVR